MPLLLDLPGLALIAGCLVLGLGLAAGGPPWLTTGERIVIGLVLAVVGLTMVGYVAALAIGVTVGLVLLLALAGIAAGGWLLWRHRGWIRAQAASPRSVLLPGVVAALALGMGYLFARAVEVTPDAWLAHYNNTWSDWSFHASYATAFVYGHNLPPQNPIFAGTPFRYPFAPDFGTALLIAGGWSIPAALAWPSWAMTVLALSGLILWARRLSGGIGAGVIAVTLTLLGGGIGFLVFFGDAARPGLINTLMHIPRSYDRSCPLPNLPPDPSCLDPSFNIQWYNPILSYYLPQRSFVFGAAMMMAVLLLLTPPLLSTPFFRWRETVATIRSAWRRWTLKSEAVAFLVAGGLTGLLPLFHVHSLLVLGIVTGCWALLFPRPAWLGFFAVTLLLAMPRLLMAVPGDPGAPPEHQYPRWLIGWVSGTDFPPWFWIKNTGLFWPLLLVALLSPLALRGRARLIIAPFSLVFLAANLVKFQPWDWDNSKLLVFWYMASAVAVGAILVRLARAHLVGALVAVTIWLSLIASGVLSLMQFLPPQGPAYVWFSSEEVQLAAQLRRQTPPRAVFVTGQEPNNPIADLAGRPEAIGLLRQYHADYIVIGPAERTVFQPDANYFNAQFRLVLHTPNYDIYAVH